MFLDPQSQLASNSVFHLLKFNQINRRHFFTFETMSLLLLAEVLHALLCVCGILANGLLIYVIGFCVSGRARVLVTSRFLMQISVADMLLSLCLPALTCSLEPRLLPRRSVSAAACDFLIAFLLLAQLARSLLLSFFSLSVLSAFRGHVLDLSNRKVSWMLVVCWSLAITGALSLVAAGGRRSALCDPYSPLSEYFAYREAFTLVYAICCHLLPLALLVWSVRVQMNPSDRLDEQQLNVRQTLKLTTQLLALHVFCATPHLICQLWFTFEPQYEQSDLQMTVLRIHRGQSETLADPLQSRLYAHWFTSCLLFSQIFFSPFLVYRLGQKFGYGPADLLEAMASNAADLQLFWRQQQQKIVQAHYDPVALYEKFKNNVCSAAKV